MKTYPTIRGPNTAKDEPCYAFVKYDGSNLRFEWSRKRGWYKFGTRKRMFDRSDRIYGPAIDFFLEQFDDDLVKVFKSEKLFQGVQNVVVFGEWFGAKSFSGQHQPNDPKDLVLFDVNPIKKGIFGPKQFIDLFGHLHVAEVVWQGEITKQFVEDVRKERIDIESKYPIRSEIPEGVVCKAGTDHRLWMCKIKTERYREALKTLYRADWAKYWEDA